MTYMLNKLDIVVRLHITTAIVWSQ